MTHKLTVRFGGAAGSEVHDYSDRVRYVDGTGPAITGGMQADNGSPGMGQFVLDDEDNDIPHRTDPPGLQLAAHNQLIWSEDSPGYDAWLSIGRIDNKNVGRPYTYTAGVNRQWVGQWADANMDLDGITLTADEARPEETDVDRILWALGEFCSGTYRLTTDFGTHLVAASPTFTMEAKTYPAGTELLEILDDCAQLAGKRYAVVIHEDSGADHACFEYIDEEDHTTYACTLSISDQLADVDGETVFEPMWRQGSATSEQGQELITGVVSRYGPDTSATVFVEDTAHADSYDRWIKPYNDDLSVSATQANARATAVVHSRWNEHVSHQPSILIPARLHNLIRAGMSIGIRSAAAMGGQYLGTTQTRRIAAIEWGAAGWRGGETMLWANLQLDRTPRQLPLSSGKTQPAATTPKPPDSGTPGTPGTSPTVDYQWHFGTNAYDDDTGTINWGTGAGRVTTDADNTASPDGGGWAHAGFTGGATTPQPSVTPGQIYNFGAYLRICTSQTGTGASSSISWLNAGGTVIRTDWLATSLTTAWAHYAATFEAPVGAATVKWNMNTGYPNAIDFDSAVMSHGGTDPVAGDPGDVPPASDDQVGAGSESGDCDQYACSDHKHPAQTAAVTPYDGTASGLTATSVQNAIDELDATVDGLAASTEEAVNTIAASGAAQTLDLADGTIQDVTLTDDATLTLTGATAGVGNSMTVLLRQDATGSRTVTWPASVSWVGGSAPTLQTAPNAVDLIALLTIDGGTTWFGIHSGESGAAVGALDDLSDVTITSPAAGDTLRYDGSAWVNHQTVELLISDATADFLTDEDGTAFLSFG